MNGSGPCAFAGWRAIGVAPSPVGRWDWDWLPERLADWVEERSVSATPRAVPRPAVASTATPAIEATTVGRRRLRERAPPEDTGEEPPDSGGDPFGRMESPETGPLEGGPLETGSSPGIGSWGCWGLTGFAFRSWTAQMPLRR
ncbi:hypothetical protein GXW82_21045 [Streptacidiphilus sp. 4-A2]|nr:hypothetical protein [Streptacidiphilus sp. 4-A2]